MNTTGLEPFFAWLLNRSWQAAVLVLCVFLIQWLFRRQLTSRWRFALWWIVLARLALPFGPESQLSLFNCFRPLRNPAVFHEAPVPAALPAARPATSRPTAAPSTGFIPPHVSATAPWPAVTGTPAKTDTESIPALREQNPAPRPASFGMVLVVGWLAGAIFLAGSVLLQVTLFNRRLARSAAPADVRRCGLLIECRRELRINRRIELLETEAVKSPALFGLFRLRLLLPSRLGAKFDDEELRYIFLHELAHVRRGDLWLNWLVTALQILHWFNPLLWLGFARLRADRELACDELALQHTGETAAGAYGSTIIKLLEGIQRPAVIPGLVGILEDQNEMRRRISRIAEFKRTTRWSMAAVLLVAGLGIVALTDAQSEGTARPDLNGTIETKDGRPVQGTVFIYTAGPKTGTSSFCPSCYVDCRKSARANAEGNFQIKSLDPQLIFRILAVAPGYKPKFVPKVDPAKGPVKIQLEPIELAAAPPGNCLHGRVVDIKGNPVAGAVVEAHGIRDFNGGGRWGQLNGVDPLAVTDEKGEFLITSVNPFDLMDVKVSARAYANKTFTKLASGNELHQLTLTEGASITGRVLFHGKPLPNVEVGVVSVDRSENFTGDFEIGTDAKGRFLLANLPPDVNYDLYGTMKTLAPFGALPVSTIRSGDDGTTTDAGDLLVTPGHRLAGQVVLADGKPLPPRTRLLISRDEAWDSMQVDLPANGRFDLGNVPPETYSLSVRVPGYHMSPKNASYDALNPGRLVGRVDGDTTHLTFLLERGAKGPAPQDYGSDVSEWPQNRALKGVSANRQADHSQDWIVSGRVTDAQTGDPLKQFSAIPGNERLAWRQIHWDAGYAASGSNGIYTVYLDKRWEQPVIKIEAAGYLPQSQSVTPLEQTNADFALEKGNGPGGFVRLPNGKPVANADVLLLCPDTQNPSLGYDNHLSAGWPQQEGVLIKSGPDGHFSFAPRIGMQSVAAASENGYAQVSVSCLATNPDIILQPYGSIQGTLERPNGPGTNEDLDLAFITPDAAGQQVRIDSSAHTDSSGHFEFTRVPAGRLELSYRVPVSQNGWQNADLQPLTVTPGQTLQLDVKAPARQTAPAFAFGAPPAAPVPIPGREIAGAAVLPDGTPAAGAQVALEIKGQFIQLGRASITSYEGWKDGWVVRADQNGKFAVPRYQNAETVMIVSDAGFARVSVDALKQSGQVTLEPWARIEGTLRIGRRPGANELIHLTDWRGMMTSNSIAPLNFDLDAYQAKTDAQGRFVLTYVPPGTHQLTRQVPEGNGWTGETLGTVDVKPGETKQVTFGGNGRTVMGKVNVDEKAPQDWQQGHLILRSTSAFEGKLSEAHSQEQRMQIIQSAAYQKEMMNLRTYRATLSQDGSFKAEDVVPGDYEFMIDFFKPGRMAAGRGNETYYLTSRHSRTVPKPVGTNDAPVDLGTVNFKTVAIPAFSPGRTNTATGS